MLRRLQASTIRQQSVLQCHKVVLTVDSEVKLPASEQQWVAQVLLRQIGPTQQQQQQQFTDDRAEFTDDRETATAPVFGMHICHTLDIFFELWPEKLLAVCAQLTEGDDLNSLALCTKQHHTVLFGWNEWQPRETCSQLRFEAKQLLLAGVALGANTACEQLHLSRFAQDVGRGIPEIQHEIARVRERGCEGTMGCCLDRGVAGGSGAAGLYVLESACPSLPKISLQ